MYFGAVSKNDTYSLSTLRVHDSIINEWMMIGVCYKKWEIDFVLPVRKQAFLKKLLLTFQAFTVLMSALLSVESEISQYSTSLPWRQFSKLMLQHL